MLAEEGGPHLTRILAGDCPPPRLPTPSRPSVRWRRRKRPMLTETTSVLVVGNRLIQFGYKRKTDVVCNIAFSRRFSTPPWVVVTPAWENAGREVGHAETIGQVTQTGVRLYSSNAASNYSLSWIAVGYRRGGADENVNFVQVGDLLIEMGKTRKQAVSVTPRLLAGFAQPPVRPGVAVLGRSAQWSRARRDHRSRGAGLVRRVERQQRPQLLRQLAGRRHRASRSGTQ